MRARNAVALGLVSGALVAPAPAAAYYRDWLQEPLMNMNGELAGELGTYDSASAAPLGCRHVRHRGRLAACRYTVGWRDYSAGDDQCVAVVYVRPHRWRFARPPRCLTAVPAGWQRG